MSGGAAVVARRSNGSGAAVLAVVALSRVGRVVVSSRCTPEQHDARRDQRECPLKLSVYPARTRAGAAADAKSLVSKITALAS